MSSRLIQRAPGNNQVPPHHPEATGAEKGKRRGMTGSEGTNESEVQRRGEREGGGGEADPKKQNKRGGIGGWNGGSSRKTVRTDRKKQPTRRGRGAVVEAKKLAMPKHHPSCPPRILSLLSLAHNPTKTGGLSAKQSTSRSFEGVLKSFAPPFTPRPGGGLPLPLCFQGGRTGGKTYGDGGGPGGYGGEGPSR